MFRRKELTKLLSYSQKHCPYYSHLLNGVKVNNSNCIDVLKELPILTKDIIRANRNTIYSDELADKPHSSRTTGGSTGEPFGFEVMAQKIDFELLLGYHLYSKMNWSYNDIIVAFDGYTPPIVDVNIDNSICRIGNNFPYGKYHFSSFLLSEDTIEMYVTKLNDIKPSIFRGYSSTISLLCRLIKKYRLKLNFKLKGIYFTSDKCTKEDEQIIREVLQCPIFGQYGHTEASVFAIKPDCSNSYYCSPVYGYTEVLDIETKRHVNIGEQGEVVVTGFTNYGLPFIRYATGDLAIYGGEDEVHNVILTELQGRSSDYIMDKLGNKIYLTGLIFGAHLNSFHHMDEWQIEQVERGRVVLHIKKGASFSKSDTNEILSLFEKVGITVMLDFDGEIVKSKRGKRLFMIQKCK